MKNQSGQAESEAKPAEKDSLKSVPTAELFKKLSSSEKGLSADEAKKRLTQYGPNEIKEEKTNTESNIPLQSAQNMAPQVN